MNSFLKGGSLLPCLSQLASRVICLFEGGHGREFETVFLFYEWEKKTDIKTEGNICLNVTLLAGVPRVFQILNASSNTVINKSRNLHNV